MNIELLNGKPILTDVQNMAVGSIAQILDGENKNHYIIRSNENFISLNDPKRVWDKQFSGIKVLILPDGASLKITING